MSILEVQERSDLPARIDIVVRSGQQLMLTEDAKRFFKKVEFDPPERLVVITRDKKIRYRAAEKRACVECSLRA
ncbi:MAG: hypothetical protein KY454_09025 [Actinobacteria bacterium]|nr:hypothetical protein [Actinomycetota bacterium]MBW3651558.1 hypothetical protein [Actinomycetota bacterium]